MMKEPVGDDHLRGAIRCAMICMEHTRLYYRVIGLWQLQELRNFKGKYDLEFVDLVNESCILMEDWEFESYLIFKM